MSDTYINGNRAAFTDTTMSAAGSDIPVGALKSLNWTGTLDPTIIQGNSVFSPGRTSGFYSASADFEMLIDESNDWEDSLTDSGSTGLLQTDFDIEVSYALFDESYTETVVLRGCRLKSHGAPAGGADALTTKYEVTVMRIERNGRADVIQ